jgi:signal transduction histidine kinase
MAEFVLQDVVVAAVSQVLIACQGKGIRVSCNLPERFMKQSIYGDGLRLQQILSDFLHVSVKFSPVGGSVEISSKLTKNSIGENLHLIDLEIRYINRAVSLCMGLLIYDKKILRFECLMVILFTGLFSDCYTCLYC